MDTGVPVNSLAAHTARPAPAWARPGRRPAAPTAASEGLLWVISACPHLSENNRERGRREGQHSPIRAPQPAPTSPWSSPFPPHFPKTDHRYFKSQKGPRGNSRESVHQWLWRVTAPRQRSTGRCSPSRPPGQASQNNRAGGLLPTANVRIRKESSRADGYSRLHRCARARASVQTCPFTLSTARSDRTVTFPLPATPSLT